MQPQKIKNYRKHTKENEKGLNYVTKISQWNKKKGRKRGNKEQNNYKTHKAMSKMATVSPFLSIYSIANRLNSPIKRYRVA